MHVEILARTETNAADLLPGEIFGLSALVVFAVSSIVVGIVDSFEQTGI